MVTFSPPRWFSRIRHVVFWPPAVVLLLALAASLVDFEGFLGLSTAANQWILHRFDGVIALAAFLAVILMAVVFVSPLGAVRLGGPQARPLLPRWNWFAITLCTTIATGILFWGTAEPLFHVNSPPGLAGAEPRTEGAARFALSTLFMHWSITPYAIYAVPSIAFAIAFHNLKRPYSLAAPLSYLVPGLKSGIGAGVIDALALFALIAGVAASLGAGVMTLAGGIDAATPFTSGPLTRAFIVVAIVLVYVASSISGLRKGIKLLSDINVRIFFLLAAFVLLAGPTGSILGLSLSAVGDYVVHFVPRSLAVISGDDRAWMRDWTIFNYANWLAWAPITALFLGRIAYGYTVREAIVFNMLAPAVFGIVWMTVFGGAALRIDATTDGALTALLNGSGPEAVIYGLLETLPLTALVIAAFLFTTFLSFVTAMDSNTHSIAHVCLRAAGTEDIAEDAGTAPRLATDGDPPSDKSADLSVKIFWGVLIGAVSYIMTATTGIDGVRMLANLGGLPGLVILIGAMLALIRMMIKHRDLS